MLRTRARHKRALIESPSTAHPPSGVRPFVHAGINMTVNHSVLELIGNTPMVKAQHLDTGCCGLFFKLESANPGGSIKDRIGRKMIEAAEQAGQIKPGHTLGARPPRNTPIRRARGSPNSK